MATDEVALISCTDGAALMGTECDAQTELMGTDRLHWWPLMGLY